VRPDDRWTIIQNCRQHMKYSSLLLVLFVCGCGSSPGRTAQTRADLMAIVKQYHQYVETANPRCNKQNSKVPSALAAQNWSTQKANGGDHCIGSVAGSRTDNGGWISAQRRPGAWITRISLVVHAIRA
jgi:hypothetical protein